MSSVKDIFEYIDSFAPFSSAAPWDNSGFLVGDIHADVGKCIVALDVTDEEISEAERKGAQLILSHHPVIFHPQRTFVKENAAFEAAAKGISVICAHTNLDKAPDGVNDTLCEILGMDFVKETPDIAEGFLNTGALPEKGTCEEIAAYISEKLGAAVRFSMPGYRPERFAVCSGAGGDLAADAKAVGCDALITGDASYHDFLDAENLGVALFAAGHFETEVPIVGKLISKLSSRFPDIDFIPSERTNPILTVK